MLVSPWGVRIYFPRGYVSYRNGSTFVRKNSAPAGTKLVPSLPQSPTQPAVFPKASRIAPRPSLRLLDASSCHRTRCPGIRATQAFVVCVTIRPFGGSGPLGSGPSPCAGHAAGLCLGVAPYPVRKPHSARQQRGATRDRGTRKAGVPPVFFVPCVFLSATIFPFMSARKHSV
jgi:hypothetical protein